MSRQMEISFKLTGNEAELKTLADALRGIGAGADTAAPQVDKFEKQLAGLTAEVERLKKQLADSKGTTSDWATSLERGALSSVNSLQSGVLSLIRNIGGVPLAMGAAAIGVGVLAKEIYSFVAAEAEAAQGLTNLSIKLGLSVQDTTELAAVAKVAGVDVNGLRGAARLLAAGLEDSEGQGKKTAAALGTLGIRTRDYNGIIRDSGPILLETLKALAKVQDTTERVFLAGKILPRGAAIEMQPLIENYDRLQKAIHDAGIEFDAMNSKKLTDMAEQINTMSVAWEQLKKSLAASASGFVIPVVLALTATITDKNGIMNSPLVQGILSPMGLGNPNDPNQPQPKGPGNANLRTDIPTGAFDDSDNIAGVKKDRTEGAAKSKAFTQQYSKSLDGMKQTLQADKKSLLELRDQLEGMPKGSVFDEKKKEFDQLRAATDALEDSIKKSEEARAFARRLPDELNKSRLTQQRVQQSIPGMRSAAFETKDENPFAQLVAKQQEEYQKIADEQAELTKKMGGAFAKQIAVVFDGKRALESGKVIGEFYKAFAEQAKEGQKAAAKTIEVSSKDLIKDLKEESKELEQQSKLIDEIIKTARDKTRTSLGFETEKSISLTTQAAKTPGTSVNQGALIQSEMQQRISLAQKLNAIDKEDIDAKRTAATDALNAIRNESNQKEVDTKIQTAFDQAHLETIQAEAKLQQDMDKAKFDAEKALLDLQQKRLQEYRDFAGSFFDALKGGGNSLGKFFQDAMFNQLKIVFQNVTQDIFQSIGKTLGGVTGGKGGKALAGTILDPNHSGKNDPIKSSIDVTKVSIDQTKVSIDLLTQAVTDNTAARQAGGSGGSGGSGGGGGLGEGGLNLDTLLAGGGDGGDTAPLTFFGEGAGGGGGLINRTGNPDALSGVSFGGDDGDSAPLSFGGFGGGGDAAGGVAGGGGSSASNISGMLSGFMKKMGGAQGMLGMVAGLGAGATMWAQGNKEGGGKGIADKISGGMTMAAALDPEPISKAALMIGATISKVVGSFLPDPRAIRDKQITQELTNSKYNQPDALNLNVDSSGKMTDTDYRGNLRVLNQMPTIDTYTKVTGFDPLNPNNLLSTGGRYIGGASTPPPAPAQTVMVSVQTMDSKSFMDNSKKIADATRLAMQNGHQINQEIAKRVNPF